MSAEPPDILLIGGGHAHVAVLADWAKNGVPWKRALLLTPERHLRYSGMVPGWISGEHGRGDGRVDLVRLARAAGIEIMLDRCVALDPDARQVLTLDHGPIAFAIASIDTGGVGQARDLLGDDPRLIDVRPIAQYVERFEQLPEDIARFAIVGGGAGGVELAFAIRNRKGKAPPPDVTMIAGAAGLLPDFSPAVRRKACAEMDRQGIETIAADARFEGGGLLAGEREIVAQAVIAATGSAAPDWPRASGLACDEAGFIAVDRFQRSLSHPHILAAGDVAARIDRDLPHSGVHAVFAGPIVAKNLRALASGKEPGRSYTPRWNNLYLLSTATGEAIASYGPLAAQGRWVSYLKAWIDKRWIRKYARISRS